MKAHFTLEKELNGLYTEAYIKTAKPYRNLNVRISWTNFVLKGEELVDAKFYFPDDLSKASESG